MTINYSKDFKKLISNKSKVEKLLHGSFYKSDDFGGWEKHRKFIAKAIHHGGSILDIGCANGFLLRCLQEWTKYELVPYGIDTEKELATEAKMLFPKFENNFAAASLNQIPSNSPKRLFWKYLLKLPSDFDFIYWNVWDNWTFKNNKETPPIRDLLKMINRDGRLILGFYDAKKENNLKRVKRLEKSGIEIDKVLENMNGHEVVVWINRVYQNSQTTD